jgi:hypothetical protein
VLQGVLQAAGFADVAFVAVHGPVYYGPDVESALGFVSGFSNVTATMESRPAAERERTHARLRDVTAAHRTLRRGAVRLASVDRHRAVRVTAPARPWITSGRRRSERRRQADARVVGAQRGHEPHARRRQ